MKRVLLATLLLSACTVGPDYAEPEAEAMPPQWDEPLPPGATPEEDAAVLARWWQTFGDPELDALVQAALVGNRDLAEAQARVREARALRTIAGAGNDPQLDFVSDATRTNFSDNGLAAGTSGGGKNTFNLYTLGFDAFWELDLFGGVRREVEAAEADLAAAEEDRRAVLVTLLGEIGREWIEARAALRRLVIARQALSSQEGTAGLTRSRRDAGMSNDLDVLRAEALVSDTRASVPALEEFYARATHRLDVLMGSAPGAAAARLGNREYVPLPPPRVPVGMPSDLLRRRPDVRRAERQLAAATARIGVATAQLYPSFSLTGTLGLASRSTGNLLEPDSRVWSMGLGLVWPIWHGGALDAQVEVFDARAEQALHRWETSVLVALQETHDALIAYGREQERRESLAQSATAQRQAAALARQRHEAGLSDFLEVLDAERSLLSAEDALVRSEAILAGDAVALYKALGGGWDTAGTTAGGGDASVSAGP